MAQQHTVKQGETLLSIAAAHDFLHWEQIWRHEKNAALRAKRDPQVLAEGDVLFIPEKAPEPVRVVSGRRTVLTTRALRAAFRMTIVDDLGKPHAGCRYLLEVGGERSEGTTDANGVVSQRIDPKPTTGTLTVFVGPKDRKLVFNLKLGDLDPIDKPSGIKARLNNLGFDCGKVEGELDAAASAALRNFQIVHRLPLTGKADEATRKRLLAVHDRR